ncbi:uncharacterized protein [Anoplolepis gracilipes]|uniref:uncharacterized protein n=1 Tax=Anoplolepis gracilipes TaxID=354296 RepID=UPI003BA23FB4
MALSTLFPYKKKINIEERLEEVRRKWKRTQKLIKQHEERKAKMIQEFENKWAAKKLKMNNKQMKQHTLRRSKSFSPARRTNDYKYFEKLASNEDKIIDEKELYRIKIKIFNTNICQRKQTTSRKIETDINPENIIIPRRKDEGSHPMWKNLKTVQDGSKVLQNLVLEKQLESIDICKSNSRSHNSSCPRDKRPYKKHRSDSNSRSHNSSCSRDERPYKKHRSDSNSRSHNSSCSRDERPYKKHRSDSNSRSHNSSCSRDERPYKKHRSDRSHNSSCSRDERPYKKHRSDRNSRSHNSSCSRDERPYKKHRSDRNSRSHNSSCSRDERPYKKHRSDRSSSLSLNTGTKRKQDFDENNISSGRNQSRKPDAQYFPSYNFYDIRTCFPRPTQMYRIQEPMIWQRPALVPRPTLVPFPPVTIPPYNFPRFANYNFGRRFYRGPC